MLTELEILKSNEVPPCISILAPTYRSKPQSLQNKLMVVNAIKRAKTLIHQSRSPELESVMMDSLNQLVENIDFSHTLDGIGLFVSPKLSKTIYFPFQVKEKVILADKFETRDVIYAQSREVNYWVLILNRHDTKLLQGKGRDLKEVEDYGFPLKYEDDFQYPEPARPYGLEGSTMEQIRLKQFLKQCDRVLGEVQKTTPLPVILLGVKQYLGYFEQVSGGENEILARINGSFDHLSMHDLSEMVWPEVDAFLKRRNEEVVRLLHESIGENRCAWGIRHVWSQALEGKGETLVVEKDYMAMAYLEGELMRTKDHHQARNGEKPLIDAVDEVINTVLNKGGNVVFVPNNRLVQFDKIALILRYP